MEKVEVEQGFLDKLLEFGLQGFQFLNSKEEPKKEEKKEEDDDKLEHNGEVYSKKELINAFTKMKENEMKEEEGKKEEEKKNAKEEKEGEEFFNEMKEKMQEKKVIRVKPETEKAAIDRGKSIYGG